MRSVAHADASKVEMVDWVHSLAPWSVIAHHTWRDRKSFRGSARLVDGEFHRAVTRFGVSQFGAGKAFERFMGRAVPEISYFYAVEQNPSRDGHHVHALWANCEEVVRKGVWRQWFDAYGRARIEPCRSLADVAGYCAKYLTKDSAWWNFRLDKQLWMKAQG